MTLKVPTLSREDMRAVHLGNRLLDQAEVLARWMLVLLGGGRVSLAHAFVFDVILLYLDFRL
jgi:hypothetical protein